MLRQIHTEFFTFIRTEKSVVEIIFIYIIEAIDIVHAKAILQSLLDTQATAYKLWGHSPDHMVIGEMSLMDCFQHRMKVEKRSSKKQDVSVGKSSKLLSAGIKLIPLFITSILHLIL